MKAMDYYYQIAALFQFKTICDERGNEYVLLANNTLNCVEGIGDRTQFEATENHVHLVDCLTKREYSRGAEVAKSIGKALLCSLRSAYPEKQFAVFASLSLNDSLIIRFHQKWPNEPLYYSVDDFVSGTETVLKFET